MPTSSWSPWQRSDNINVAVHSCVHVHVRCIEQSQCSNSISSSEYIQMMSQNGPAALPGSPSTGLTAAALQDHLSRQLGLSLSEPLSSQRSHHSHSCVSKREGRVNAVSCRTRAVRGKHSWSGSRHVGRSGRREEERERVLDPMPPSLSLAQRMGLVERPTGHLTSGDWGQVKIVSRDRGDSSQPCPICQEEFGMKEQVREPPCLTCIPGGPLSYH